MDELMYSLQRPGPYSGLYTSDQISILPFKKRPAIFTNKNDCEMNFGINNSFFATNNFLWNTSNSIQESQGCVRRGEQWIPKNTYFSRPSTRFPRFDINSENLSAD